MITENRGLPPRGEIERGKFVLEAEIGGDGGECEEKAGSYGIVEKRKCGLKKLCFTSLRSAHRRG